MRRSAPKIKIAPTEFDIHPLIKQRWSPRAFADEAVEPALLRQLFDAARWAPSSFNEQPWRFIVATKQEPDAYQKLAQVMNDKNRSWATSAPVLILTVKKDRFERNDRSNIHAGHDLGQAVSFLTFEAMRHDLFVHQMAGISPENAQELYKIPENFTPMTMIALGYLGERLRIPERFHKGETSQRRRREMDEIAFRGTWNDRKIL